jgi:hypothetical protein
VERRKKWGEVCLCGGVCFCCVIMFKSNVGLCISVYVSFVCSFCVLSYVCVKTFHVFIGAHFSVLSMSIADHSDRAVKGMNRLRPLEHWDCGFKSHSRHECLSAFILCLCCSVCRCRPSDGPIPRPRSPTDCILIKKLKKRPRSTRAVQP